MLVLAIDASTYSASAALIRDGIVNREATAVMRGQVEERLMPAIVNLLESSGAGVGELDAVACGAGPGSFTSLRIGASIAKGIAVARGIPMFTAPSTLLVAAAVELPAGSYVTALDAMRGDWFCQHVVVGSSGDLSPGESWRVPRAELVSRAAALGARVIGPGEEPPILPHARGFAAVMRQSLAVSADVASWEPDYGRKAEAQVRWEAAHGRELEAL